MFEMIVELYLYQKIGQWKFWNQKMEFFEFREIRKGLQRSPLSLPLHRTLDYHSMLLWSYAYHFSKIEPEIYNTYDVADTMKKYFKSLEEPIFTLHLNAYFLATTGIFRFRKALNLF